MSKEPAVAQSQHHCMTVLFHSGTLCPEIGSGCVLSAVCLQVVMKTHAGFAWCSCLSCHELYYRAMIQICAALMFSFIFICLTDVVVCVFV